MTPAATPPAAVEELVRWRRGDGLGTLPAVKLWRRDLSRGRIDAAVLLALAAMVTALAAVVMAVVMFRAVREDAQHARFSAGLESLWRLRAEWNSDDMLDARTHAAAALLASAPTADVSEVLDFFDELALLVQRGIVDEDMVWFEFYWPMANYWFASQEYVHQTQRDTPGAWAEMGSVMPRLLAIEARRKKRSATAAVPSPREIHDFLTDETEESQCTEDEGETRRTPL
jgi:hypothetical protein